MSDRLVIGSRGSKLALTQAEWVKARLASLHPGIDILIEIIKTTGDVKTDPLAVIGGKGVFTKELEDALLDRRIDVAVHSLKDLPTIVPEALAIGAICEREDPRDALVLQKDSDSSCASLKDLPVHSIVGTSSPRRQAQLRHLRPDLVIKDLRGNVDTRLRKLDEGQYDAVILAAAGLRRLALEGRISARIPPEQMLPAVGQGAIGVELRADDSAAMNVVTKLDHEATRIACTAERALLRALGGGCQLPIAAHCVVQYHEMRIDGLVASRDGKRIVRDHISGSTEDAEKLGGDLANRLLEHGAKELLALAPEA
jgi:hydroxymethylbilane synthase